MFIPLQEDMKHLEARLHLNLASRNITVPPSLRLPLSQVKHWVQQAPDQENWELATDLPHQMFQLWRVHGALSCPLTALSVLSLQIYLMTSLSRTKSLWDAVWKFFYNAWHSINCKSVFFSITLYLCCYFHSSCLQLIFWAVIITRSILTIKCKGTIPMGNM